MLKILRSLTFLYLGCIINGRKLNNQKALKKALPKTTKPQKAEGSSKVKSHALFLFILTAIAASGCTEAPSAPITASLRPAPPAPRTGPIWLSIPTYDGKGQAVHPDVIVFEEPWNGFKCYLMVTPFNDSLGPSIENPSLLVSNDPECIEGWIPRPGAPSPLVTIRRGAIHNSDNDFYFDELRNKLVISWREVARDANVTSNIIWTIESSDGIRFSAPRRAFSERAHRAVSQAAVVTPAIAGGLRPRMWYVDSNDGCTSSSTKVMTMEARGLNGLGAGLSGAAWGTPVLTDFSQPGYIIWHPDMYFVTELRLYVSIYAAYSYADYLIGMDCSATDLFLATSEDGIRWRTFSEPILRKGFADWAEREVYRGTLNYSNGRLRIWFSAYGRLPVVYAHGWSIGYTDYNMSELVAALEGGN